MTVLELSMFTANPGPGDISDVMGAVLSSTEVAAAVCGIATHGTKCIPEYREEESTTSVKRAVGAKASGVGAAAEQMTPDARENTTHGTVGFDSLTFSTLINGEPVTSECTEVHRGHCCDWCYQKPILGRRYIWRGRVTTDVCEHCFREFEMSTDDPNVIYASDSAGAITVADVVCPTVYRMHRWATGPNVLQGPIGVHQLNVFVLMDVSQQIAEAWADMITAYAKIWHEGQLADGYRAIYSAARWEVSSASVPLNVVEAIHRLRDQGDAAMRQVVDMYVRPVQEHMLVRPGDAGSVRNTKLQATLSILSGATGALREEAKVMRAGVLPEQWEERISSAWDRRYMYTASTTSPSDVEHFMRIGQVAGEGAEQILLGLTSLSFAARSILLFGDSVSAAEVVECALRQQQDSTAITQTPCFLRHGVGDLMLRENHSKSILFDTDLVTAGQSSVSMGAFPDRTTEIVVHSEGEVTTILVDGTELRLCELPEVDGCGSESARVSALLKCSYDEGGRWKGACAAHDCDFCDHSCKGNFLMVNTAIAMALCDARVIRHESKKLFLFCGPPPGENFVVRYTTNWHWANEHVFLG